MSVGLRVGAKCVKDAPARSPCQLLVLPKSAAGPCQAAAAAAGEPLPLLRRIGVVAVAALPSHTGSTAIVKYVR